MPEQTQSRFGVNLFAQFILIIILSAFSAAGLGTISVVFGMFSTILSLTFSFGLLYGLFRLLGAKSAALEGFYQSFPFGMGSGFGMEAVKNADKVAPDYQAPAPLPPRQPINWHKIFSFQFLRFVGVLLILTSIFSLLFNIEWQLIHKVLASALTGLMLLGGAEWVKRNSKVGISPFCAILGFTLLQFSLSLMYKYSLEQQLPELFQTGDTWMYLKMALSVGLLFIVTRYRAPWLPLLYVLVAYFSASSLQYVGANLSVAASALFLMVMTGIALLTAWQTEHDEILPVNAVLANIYLALLVWPQATYGLNAMSVRYAYLALLVGIFAVQLFASVFICAKRQKYELYHVINVVIAHVAVMLGLTGIQAMFPLIQEYIGIAFLIVANVTLCAYLVAGKLKADRRFTDVLFNVAVIVASVGLFVQVRGQWSAVVFLAYSTGVLWLSLYRMNIRTRIYGSVLLIVSLIKLYLEFSEIFDQVWGSVAILAIGLLLVVLSYKFEAVKDVMMHGLNKKSDA